MDARWRKKGSGKWLLLAFVLALPILLSCGFVSQPAAPEPTSTAPATASPPGATTTPLPTVPAAKPTMELGLRAAWRTSRIAFASNRSGRFQIYLMRPDGSQLAQLTDSPGDNLAPAWSEDANRIFFVSTRDGNSEIYSMNRDGTGQTNLTKDPHEDVMPLALPKGKLAFISNRLGKQRLFLMNADGTDLKSFSRTSADATAKLLCLVWFDETTMFYTTEDGQVRLTRAVDASTGDVWVPRSLAGKSDRSCPVVSSLRNSDWVMFISNRDGHDEIYGFQDIEKQDTRFTFGTEPSLGITRSADQSWISFSSKRPGNWDIYVMILAGRNEWDVTNNPADDIQPAWEPY